jgi:hypothetical protein
VDWFRAVPWPAHLLTNGGPSREGVRLPNKAMKLTKLSPAPFRGRSAGSCPRRPISDAGTASQLIAGVRPT